MLKKEKIRNKDGRKRIWLQARTPASRRVQVRRLLSYKWCGEDKERAEGNERNKVISFFFFFFCGPTAASLIIFRELIAPSTSLLSCCCCSPMPPISLSLVSLFSLGFFFHGISVCREMRNEERKWVVKKKNKIKITSSLLLLLLVLYYHHIATCVFRFSSSFTRTYCM